MISMAKYLSHPFKFYETTNTNKITSLRELKIVGLKILTTKTIRNHSKPIIFQRNQIPSSSSCNNNSNSNHSSCFLKSCFLCHKHLSPNKDVYMYRGDQGFCSEECRNRQIYIDDVNELEISTRKMIQQFRQSSNRSRCNTHYLSRRQKSMASPIFSQAMTKLYKPATDS